MDSGKYFIRLLVNFGDAGARMFIVEQTKDSMKLDWEIAVGYQAMPLEKFKKEQPRKPTEFRVKIKPGDYYSNQFFDKEEFAAVDLSYPGNREFKLNGYINRERPWAAKVLNQLESGIAPSMIVNLRYPEGEIKDDRQVEIVSITSESWLVRTEVEKDSGKGNSSHEEKGGK